MISARKKALELVGQFKSYAHCDFNPRTGYDLNQRDGNAIQCAMIAVNEILSTSDPNDGMISYWKEVMQELEHGSLWG